jgi:hypothetical protein
MTYRVGALAGCSSHLPLYHHPAIADRRLGPRVPVQTGCLKVVRMGRVVRGCSMIQSHVNAHPLLIEENAASDHPPLRWIDDQGGPEWGLADGSPGVQRPLYLAA